MKTLKELEQESSSIFEGYEEYKPVNAKCEVCGGQLYINNSIILTSYPPMFQYKCSKCGHIELSTLRL